MSSRLENLLNSDYNWNSLLALIEQGERLTDSQVGCVLVDWIDLFGGAFPSTAQLNALQLGNLINCQSTKSSSKWIPHSTLLHWALIENQLEEVKRVLDAGIDPNVRGRFGLTALGALLPYSKIDLNNPFPVDAFCLLLDKGADINDHSPVINSIVSFSFLVSHPSIEKTLSAEKIALLWQKIDEAGINWDKIDNLERNIQIMFLEQSDPSPSIEVGRRLIDRGVSFNGRFMYEGKWRSYRDYCSQFAPGALDVLQQLQKMEKAQLVQKKLQAQTPVACVAVRRPRL